MKKLSLSLISILIVSCCSSQTIISLRGQKFRLISKGSFPIIYDTIIYKHDTAFIYRSNKMHDMSFINESFDTTENFVINADLVEEYVINDKYFSKYLRKKYRKNFHNRVKTYKDFGGAAGITDVVAKRVFYYHWSYENDTETAEGSNYLVQQKPPSNKQLKALIAKTCKKKNVDFYIEEL